MLSTQIAALLFSLWLVSCSPQPPFGGDQLSTACSKLEVINSNGGYQLPGTRYKVTDCSALAHERTVYVIHELYGGGYDTILGAIDPEDALFF